MSVPDPTAISEPGTFAPDEFGAAAQVEDTPEQAAAKATRAQRLDALAAKLAQEAVSRVGIRKTIEERWLEDLRQYNGAYDEQTLSRIKSNEGSEVFVNLTRSKTKTAESRLGDMLFPTDDTNWDISPTPVPTMAAAANDTRPFKRQDGSDVPHPQTGQPMTVADAAMQAMHDAKKKAELMYAEIDDQLTESQYSINARQVIHHACLLGTGVVKGPIVVGRTRRSWRKVTAGERTVRVLELVEDHRAAVKCVNPWNFFPDMSVAVVEDGKDVFERDYLTTRAMKNLRQDPYYIKEQVERVLKLGFKSSHMTRSPVNEMRASAYENDGQSTQQVANELFEVWEYHGPITFADLRACGVKIPQKDGDDPNAEIMGCVVFCGSIVIKAYLNPLETGELPYSVYNYEKDEASIFGYGVPYRMRNSQRVINAAWRALMDNAALSVGPQIVVNKKIVQPADGDYRLKARQIWELVAQDRSVRDAFATFEIPSHQAELQAIIKQAMDFADQETSLPIIAQGDMGPHITKTEGGISILMNAANVVTRSSVRNFDDGITVPIITRFYDWNMQYSPKEEIKGDYEVDARGSSVLLAKELQAKNLMLMANAFANHPVFGPMTKAADLFRKTVQAMHIAADEVVKTDAEIEQAEKARAAAPPLDPKVQIAQIQVKAEADKAQQEHANLMQVEAARHDARIQEMEMERELALITVASRERMTVAQLKAMLASVQLKTTGQRTIVADQAAIKAQSPDHQGVVP